MISRGAPASQRCMRLCSATRAGPAADDELGCTGYRSVRLVVLDRAIRRMRGSGQPNSEVIL